VLQVSNAPADRHSGGLVNASFECFLAETVSPIEALVNGVAEADTVGRIAFVFCFEWSRESALTAYRGSASELSTYLRLNGGPYRLTYGPPKYSSPDIDLDTPLVWFVSHRSRLSPEDRLAIRRVVGSAICLREAYGTLTSEWLPDSPPPTLVFASLGESLIRNLASVPEDEVIALCATVEDLMTYGNETLKNALSTGFLEAILAAASGGMSIGPLARHFGPSTMAYCKAWDVFTGCKTEGIS
jgi:hypothetical protein